jgi:hypothetical protein
MQRIIITLVALIFFINTYAQENLKTVKGKISYLDMPVVNANVMVSSSEAIFKSTVDGSYEVQAYQGDIITFSYPSLREMEIVVEDVTRILNITMSANINELDEVIVEASKRRSQRELEEDYVINKNIIKTAYGYLDADRAPGYIRFLNESQINSVNQCILELLRSEFGGVRVYGDCQQGGSVSIRGFGSMVNPRFAIYDVDGQIFNDAPIWLDVQNFKRIAILNNLANTTRYGSIAAGGVVVINTINGNPRLGKTIDRAKLRHNIYQNDAITETQVVKNVPIYLSAMMNSNSVEDAKKAYNDNLKKYYNAPHFFIDSYAYFMDRGADKFASEILKKNLSLFERNAVYLKALAFYAEANGALDKSNELYEQVFILRPNYSQSYRDLAENYRDVKNYKKAAAMYARYNYLVEEGFLESDSLGLGSIIQRDSENLLAIEGDKVMDGGKTGKRLAKYADFKGTRLLFEWNDSEAEFELQFVNPEKHYYTWKHTYEANATRIMNEKLNGYSSEEFLVDGSLAGKWQVNVNYKGNKKLEPTYLKVTTYFNYGKTSQRKEVNVYRMSLKNVNQRLFDIMNAGSITN